jgi:glycosyltransferase involved in cell wall biosynthesis
MLFDVVGCFGTRLSYATVASRVAHALRDAGLLGSVTNVDLAWHEDYAGLRRRNAHRGTHVVLFTPPYHYLDVYSEVYGRERSAIFASPNTYGLSPEHATTLSKFGAVLCPSEFCAGVVYAHQQPGIEQHIIWHPLGFDEALFASRSAAIAARRGRLSHPARLLHLTTDHFWPGRKGTEELLLAWQQTSLRGAELRVHVPHALYPDVVRLCRDRDVHVEVVTAGPYGCGTDGLLPHFDWADGMVAPSRAEGFGIMLLSALGAGLPLLATPGTGQRSFLQHLRGWMSVGEGESASLAGEHGVAPTVDPAELARSLAEFVSPDARGRLLSELEDGQPLQELLWPNVAREYARILTEWAGGA